MILHSYNRGAGIKALKGALEVLGERMLILDREPKGSKPFIVCWGSAPLEYPRRQSMTILNPPEATGVFSNKLRCFEHIGHLPCIPEWTTDPDQTIEWPLTVIRHVLTGSGGKGIELVEQFKGVPKAPLYTRYQKKASEFRVHVFRLGQKIELRCVQKKVKKDGAENRDFKIRNLKNGFVFQRHDFEVPPCVEELASTFFAEYCEGLDFIALDVIYSKAEDRAWVLEGNTAPGLVGETVDVYANFLMERKRLR